MKRTCPRCQMDLEAVSENGVEVDVCRRCNGLFLDRGEMAKLVPTSKGDIEYCTESDDVVEDMKQDDHPCVCPSCTDNTMRKVEFLSYSEVILDFCDECGGFWLDGGELERIRAELDGLKDQKPTLWLRFSEFLRFLPV